MENRSKAVRLTRLLIGVVFVTLLVIGPALFAAAADSGLPQELPYTTPDLNQVETPAWLRPLEPIAQLPLWGQAAVLSAGVAGLFFLIPMVFRWAWKLTPGTEYYEQEGEHE